MEKKLYYAVSGQGQGCIYVTHPVRDDHRKVWLGEIQGLYCRLVMQLEAEGFQLPELKWQDEPITLTLKIGI